MSALGTRHRLLVLLVAVQVALLLGISLLQGARIAAGTQVRVEVRPVDPLDLARGAFVDLGYEFEELPVPPELEQGDDAYVVLERPSAGDDPWEASRIAADEDELLDADAFIRLGVAGREDLDTSPIGTYYASGDEAKALERELMSGGGIAVISLDEDGSPTLLRVERR